MRKRDTVSPPVRRGFTASKDPSARRRRLNTYGDVIMCNRPVVEVPKKTTAPAMPHCIAVAALSPMTSSGPPMLVKAKEKSDNSFTFFTPLANAPSYTYLPRFTCAHARSVRSLFHLRAFRYEHGLASIRVLTLIAGRREHGLSSGLRDRTYPASTSENSCAFK